MHRLLIDEENDFEKRGDILGDNVPSGCRRSWLSIDSVSLSLNCHGFLGNIVEWFPVAFSIVLNSM